MAAEGFLLATSSADGTVRLWDSADGQCTRVLTGHLDAVTSVHVDPLGKYVVSTSADSTARVWSVASGLSTSSFAEHDGEVLCAAFSPDGTRVVTGGRDGFGLVWVAATGQPARPGTLKGHGGGVSAVAWAPLDLGGLLLTGSLDSHVRVFNGYGNQVVFLSGHEDEISAVAWAPDGSTAASASEDGCAKVWQWNEGVCLATLALHQDSVTSVAYAPDSGKLATSGADGTARVWTLTGSCLHSTPKPDEELAEVTRVVWSPCGTRIATSSLDGTAAVWALVQDESECQRVATLRGHNEGVTCIAYPCGVLCDTPSGAAASKKAARPVATTAESSDATKREEVSEEVKKDAAGLADVVASAKAAGEAYKKDPTKWLDDL